MSCHCHAVIFYSTLYFAVSVEIETYGYKPLKYVTVICPIRFLIIKLQDKMSSHDYSDN